MSRTYYTTKTSLPINISYCCSKCHSKNNCEYTIKEKAIASHYGMYTNSKVRNESKQTAAGYLLYRFQLIQQEAQNRRYRTAEVYCKCWYCGNVEPWAKMRFSRIDKLFLAPAFVVGIIALLLLLSGEIVTALLIAGIYGGIFGLWQLYKILRYTQLESQIALLPEECLPTFSLPSDEKE